MTRGSSWTRFGGGESGPKGSSSSTVGWGSTCRFSDLAERLCCKSLDGALAGELVDAFASGLAGVLPEGPVREPILGGFAGVFIGDLVCVLDVDLGGEVSVGGPPQLLLLVVSLCGTAFGSAGLGFTSSSTSSSAQYWYQYNPRSAIRRFSISHIVIAFGADTDFAIRVMIIWGFVFFGAEPEAPVVLLRPLDGGGGSGKSSSRHWVTFFAIEVEEMILCACVTGAGLTTTGGGGGVFGAAGTGGAGGGGTEDSSMIESAIVYLNSLESEASQRLEQRYIHTIADQCKEPLVDRDGGN